MEGEKISLSHPQPGGESSEESMNFSLAKMDVADDDFDN
jgi:hypothetical protein